MMWSGFDLRPRNLFDRTPFYPYTPTPSRPLAHQRTEPGLGEEGRRGSAAVETPPNRPGPDQRK